MLGLSRYRETRASRERALGGMNTGIARKHVCAGWECRYGYLPDGSVGCLFKAPIPSPPAPEMLKIKPDPPIPMPPRWVSLATKLLAEKLQPEPWQPSVDDWDLLPDE